MIKRRYDLVIAFLLGAVIWMAYAMLSGCTQVDPETIRKVEQMIPPPYPQAFTPTRPQMIRSVQRSVLPMKSMVPGSQMVLIVEKPEDAPPMGICWAGVRDENGYFHGKFWIINDGVILKEWDVIHGDYKFILDLWERVR